MAVQGLFEENKNRSGIDVTSVTEMVDKAMIQAKSKLSMIHDAGSSVSIGNMFDMQLLMNRLAQFSEMGSAVLSAVHQSIQSLIRNVK